MPMRQVTVTTAVTPLATQNMKRKALAVKNTTATELRFSDKQVNILTDGWPLANGEGASLIKRDGDEPEYAYYGQVAAGTTTVQVYEGFGEEE